MTLDRFLALPDREGRQESNRGRVIESPPPKYDHSLTPKKIYDRLALVLEEKGFSETGFLPAPEVVRQPDVAAVEEARLKDAKADDYLAGAPLLAIEVAPPANTAEELDLKIDQYLSCGPARIQSVCSAAKQPFDRQIGQRQPIDRLDKCLPRCVAGVLEEH